MPQMMEIWRNKICVLLYWSKEMQSYFTSDAPLNKWKF